LRLFSFGGYGLALVALALVVFGAIECPPPKKKEKKRGWISVCPCHVHAPWMPIQAFLSEQIFRHGYYHGFCMDTSTRVYFALFLNKKTLFGQ